MAGYGWISFTTDYGLSDGFVAACHGVIARLAPQVRVIDVGHQVAAGDIRGGAALLAQTLPYLPPAVHLAVVDPQVGTARRPVAVRAGQSLLVGPDNGLLSWAVDALGGAAEAVELTNGDWFLEPVSRTFHGRDIFAPVAARLAAGAPLAEAGASLPPPSLLRLPAPAWHDGAGWLVAEVVAVDRFGNVQLAAPGARLEPLAAEGDQLVVTLLPEQSRAATAVRGTTFADAAAGELVVVVDSADRVAIAVNGGHAGHVLGAVPGSQLRISRSGH